MRAGGRSGRDRWERHQGRKWKVCVYIRLSREDGRAGERERSPGRKSESIENQRSILSTWIERYFPQGTYELVDFFEDDGMTGTDDTRDGFMRMLGVIEEGGGNCVVVKTLSRAFRNYADQGYYLEEYFPARNVRFISTMDAFLDTYAEPEAVYSLDVPMYGVLNDRFAAATSRAVRRTFDDKRSKGKFIGAFPAWGFLKDPSDKNRLILDPDTIAIKRQMRDWLVYDGMSLAGVARKLNEMGVPNPSGYKRLKGWDYYNPHALENDGLWRGDTVKRALLNPANAGDMVQGRQRTVSYKLHDRINVPEEEWYVVADTHEAVFSREEYEALENILRRDMRTADGAEKVSLFAGFVRCAGCGKAMQRSHSGNRIYYKCRTRAEKSRDACTVRSFREDRLKKAVLAAVRIQIGRAIQTGGSDVWSKKSGAAPWRDDMGKYGGETGGLKRLYREKEQSIRRMEKLYDGLYEEWKSGGLTRGEYDRMRTDYRARMERMREEQRHITEETELAQERQKAEMEMFSEFMRTGDIKELDRTVLTSFIDTIYVHGGAEITICFNFGQRDISTNLIG